MNPLFFIKEQNGRFLFSAPPAATAPATPPTIIAKAGSVFSRPGKPRHGEKNRGCGGSRWGVPYYEF